MPGQTLNIPYPSIGEPIATALAKLIAALQTIQADVEPKVLGSEIQWLADFSASGRALTDLSKIQLDDIASAVGLETGTVFFQGGELCVQTGAGVVQVTLNGTINAAAIGGIAGDYGGGNPARVTYTDATGTYTFTDDTNDWSDLEVAAVKLRNNNNWHTFKANASTTGPQNWEFGAANNIGTAILRQSSAGVVGSAATVTAELAMSGAVAFSGAGKVKHGSRSRTILGRAVGSLTNAGQFNNGVVVTVGVAAFNLDTPPTQEWERLVGFTVHVRKTNANNAAFTPNMVDASVSGTPAAVGSTANTTAIGYVAVSVPLTTPRAYSSDETFFIAASGFNTGDVVTGVSLNFDSV